LTHSEVVIVSAVRTAMGKFNGTLKGFRAPELGKVAIQGALEKAGLSPEAVTEVIMGNVLSAGIGQNPARQASIYAGIPYSAGGLTVNKVCGSGMKAMMLGACEILAHKEDVVVCGGMENMNQAPYALPKAREGYRLNDGTLKDLMVNDGLWDIYNDFHMGLTGEIIAEKYNIPREEIDAFACRSHLLAHKAHEEGWLKDQIIPIEVPQRKADPIRFEYDEGIRSNTSAESMGKLKAAFKKDGVVTAGNASQISDGAAATILMSREKAEELGVKPMAKIVDFNTAGVEPELVMYAPVPGVKDILAKTGFTIGDFDLIEHNEAFASASVAVQKEFEIPDEKFNITGGATAMGHPIGASGTRIMVTLLHNLKRLGLKRGMGTICLGGGNATTMIVEMEE
jgi:acetyl-CoA C-acetyltransferase